MQLILIAFIKEYVMSNTAISFEQQRELGEVSPKQFKTNLWFIDPEGYFSLPRVIRYDRRLSNSEFRVLVAIASFVFQHNSVFPSREAIQDCTGMSPTNISRATRSLKKYGWIVKTKRAYNSVVYELKIPQDIQISKS